MDNKNANCCIASLVIFAFLAFPVIGLPEICGDIDMSDVFQGQVTNPGGTTTVYPISWMTRQDYFMTPDSSANPSASPLRLFENGIEIGPAHSTSADIHQYGGGRFSHWGVNGNNLLTFSTPPNPDGTMSDPRTNGKTHQYGGIRMPTFTVTKVADVLTGYGTFQSHNQKIVQNAYGLFMAYSYAADGDSSGNEAWRLSRSIDGGKTWGTIWRGMTPTRPPILETDTHGSIFLIHSDNTTPGGDGIATFYRFDPEKSFTNPTRNTIKGGSAGKFTSVWDEARQRLYYMTMDTYHGPNTFREPNNNFFALDRAGNVLFKYPLTCAYVNGGAKSSTPTPGCTTTSLPAESFVEYPYLEFDGFRLYAAWTTSPASPSTQTNPNGTKSIQRYRAIFYIYSEDGGQTWRAPRITGPFTLTPPIVGNEHGPAQRVNITEEPTYTRSLASIWLWNVISKGGYLYFAYSNELPPGQQHYMRFSPTTGARDIDAPGFQGQYLSTRADSGFFATDPLASTPLFIVTSAGERLELLSSSDLGHTWNDVAISDIKSPPGYYWYAISGNRRLTRTGDIIGHVTTTQFPFTNDTKPAVHFFREHVVDRSKDLTAQWVFVTIDATQALPNGGYAYTLPMTGVEFGSDTLHNLNYSKLRLFENGGELGPAHSNHADIRSTGAGRFSHWTSDTLYFSASDNSDPRTNGRTYQVAFPSTEARGLIFYGKIDPKRIALDQGYSYTISQSFGTSSDSPIHPTSSQLVLYEDGVPLGPAHSPINTIHAAGTGAYIHWGNTLYFSASDNTDPRTNGRSYSFAINGSVTPSLGDSHQPRCQCNRVTTPPSRLESRRTGFRDVAR